jgi:hypothetical protein
MVRERDEKVGSQTGGMLFHVVGLPCRDLLDNRVWGSRKKGRGRIASGRDGRANFDELSL